jgi:hypothetical protein
MNTIDLRIKATELDLVVSKTDELLSHKNSHDLLINKLKNQSNEMIGFLVKNQYAKSFTINLIYESLCQYDYHQLAKTLWDELILVDIEQVIHVIYENCRIACLYPGLNKHTEFVELILSKLQIEWLNKLLVISRRENGNSEMINLLLGHGANVLLNNSNI